MVWWDQLRLMREGFIEGHMHLVGAGIDIDRSGISPDFSRVPSVTEGHNKLGACTVPK